MNYKDSYFFISLFLSRLADQIVLFIVPLVIFQLTGNASLSAIVFFIETLFRYCTFPIAGVLSDYFSPYKILKYSQFLRFFIIPLGLFGYYLIESVFWLVVISALIGIFTSVGSISREVILPQAFVSGRFETVLSFTSLADQTGTVLGPVIAAVLLTMIDWQLTLLLTSIMFICADLAIHLWWHQKRPNVKALDTSKARLLKPLLMACQTIINIPSLMLAILMAFAVNLVLGTTLATMVPIYTGELAQSETSYAGLQTAGAIVTIIILIMTARFAFSLKFLGCFSFLAICLGGILTTFSHNVPLYIVGFLLIIGFDKMFSIFVRSLRRKLIPAEHMGKTTGVIVLLNNISQPLAGLIVALLIGFMPIHSIVLFITLFATLAGLLLFIYMMKRKIF